LVHTSAENMDAELWNAGASIAKKAVQVLQQKKEFILAHPDLAQAPVDTAAITQNWDPLVDVLATIVNSELADLEKLKTFDMGAFLDGTGKTLGEKMVAIAKAAGDQDLPVAGFPAVPVDAQALSGIADAKISTVKTDGDTATIRIEKDGEFEEHELVRVEGKWLPKEMVEKWDESIASAKLAMSTVMGVGLQENKEQALAGMTMVGLVLNGLLATQTQEEFNQAIDDLKKQFIPQMEEGEAEGVEMEGVEIEGGDIEEVETEGGDTEGVEMEGGGTEGGGTEGGDVEGGDIKTETGGADPSAE
jgi:hypothetical protein